MKTMTKLLMVLALMAFTVSCDFDNDPAPMVVEQVIDDPIFASAPGDGCDLGKYKVILVQNVIDITGSCNNASNVVIDNLNAATANICSGTYTVKVTVVGQDVAWHVTAVTLDGVTRGISNNVAYWTFTAFGASWDSLPVSAQVSSPSGGSTYLKFKVTTAQYHQYNTTEHSSVSIGC